MTDPWTELMRNGDHAGARAISDRVLGERRAAGAVADDPALPYHARFVWTGRPLDDADVLVRCYHGLGDALMFARFLAPLAARAERVRVELPAPLVPLLGPAVPGCRFLPFDHAHPLPPGGVDVEMTELGHALRLDPETAAPRAPPVRPAPLAAGTVGVCWRAGPWLPSRSVPLAALVPALRACGRPLLAFGQEAARSDARAVWPAWLAGSSRADDTLARTAALVAGCALVVSVDTMVAHLALLLGRPTIVLLRRDADWRWGRAGQPSPWYRPATLLRQSVEGDWTGPLDALATLLRPED